jgi:hypothetical protein
MVWRLVQLRGSGAATPHGVTALPPAQQQQHQDEQQQQQFDATQDAASSHQRRQVFPSGPQQSPGTAADAQSADNTAGSAGSSSSSGSSSSGSSSDWLYEQLVGCRQQLSNVEKLNLLHFGALEGPPAAQPGLLSAASLDAGSKSEDEGWDDEGSATKADDSGLDDDEQQQQQQQQQLGGVDAWGGLGEHGPATERHFSKQQVRWGCCCVGCACCSCNRCISPTAAVLALRAGVVYSGGAG